MLGRFIGKFLSCSLGIINESEKITLLGGKQQYSELVLLKLECACASPGDVDKLQILIQELWGWDLRCCIREDPGGCLPLLIIKDHSWRRQAPDNYFTKKSAQI